MRGRQRHPFSFSRARVTRLQDFHGSDECSTQRLLTKGMAAAPRSAGHAPREPRPGGLRAVEERPPRCGTPRRPVALPFAAGDPQRPVLHSLRHHAGLPRLIPGSPSSAAVQHLRPYVPRQSAPCLPSIPHRLPRQQPSEPSLPHPWPPSAKRSVCSAPLETLCCAQTYESCTMPPLHQHWRHPLPAGAHGHQHLVSFAKCTFITPRVPPTGRKASSQPVGQLQLEDKGSEGRIRTRSRLGGASCKSNDHQRSACNN